MTGRELDALSVEDLRRHVLADLDTMSVDELRRHALRLSGSPADRREIFAVAKVDAESWDNATSLNRRHADAIRALIRRWCSPEARVSSERDYEAVIRTMREAGREDVIHFAGAAHRDPAAARVVEQWLLDPTATVRALRCRALGIPEESL